jgi:hypothetical protein
MAREKAREKVVVRMKSVLRVLGKEKEKEKVARAKVTAKSKFNF